MPTEINSRQFIEDELNSLKETGGLLDGAKVILWTNDTSLFTPTPLTTYADLTQPAFTGYAISAALVWRDAYIGADGSVHLSAPSVLFRASAAVSPGVTVYGYAIVGVPGAGNKLANIVILDTPFTFTLANEALEVEIDITRPA